MPQKRLDLDKVKLKMPFLEIEWKNRSVKDVPVHIFSKHNCRDIGESSTPRLPIGQTGVAQN